MNIADFPGLQALHFLGLRTDVKGPAQFVADDEIVYAVGGILAINNHQQKREKFIRLPERGLHINAICVSPNKKVIAVSEMGETPSITIYDVATQKRRKQITMPPEKQIQSKYFECMAFTLDSKMLLAVVGDPDWTLVSFRWDKAKLESSTRANNYNMTGTIKQIACNPSDYGMIALAGDVVFRLLTVSESVWRQYGYSKNESINFTCAAWLSQDKLLAGTTDGRLMVIDSGELKAIYHAEDLTNLDLAGKEDLPAQSSVTSLPQFSEYDDERKGKKDMEIRALIAFKNGFAFSYGVGTIQLFEKETPTKYKKRNIFKIEKDELFDDLCPELAPSNIITSLTVNSLEDTMIATCRIPQLFSIPLWGPDMSRLPEIEMEQHGVPLHRGCIRDMAVCKWKPTLLTAGKEDRSLRIWDYEKEAQMLYKQYQEDIYSVDMHPTGLYAVVGFASKLRYLTILIDEFIVTREIPIRYCNVCKFSEQGHLFAAVNGNVIMIYSSISFENVINLKGHNGRITGLAWTLSDYRMISCGTEGAVYEWSIAEGKRITEVIIKTCKFSGCAVTKDAKIIYTVGSDGEVKEIVNGIVRTAQQVDHDGLDSIVLSNSNMMLFVSGKNGTLFSVKVPLKETPDFYEFNFHNHVVPNICFSFDDKYLLTSSLDGTLLFWKLINTLGKTLKLDKDFSISQEILIPYDDLAEKMYTIKDLSMRMTELVTEHAYQMRQTEAQHASKIKDIHEAYCLAIEELKEKNTQLVAEHAQEMHALNMEITNNKRDHDFAMQNLESTYNEKLIFEYTKYLELEDKMGQIRKENDGHIQKMIEERKFGEAELTEKFLEQLQNKDIIIEELKEDILQRVKEHEIIKQQIEDDADREIYELKTQHECELKEELETNIKIRAENGIYRKKVTGLQKEVDELKHTIFTLEGEHVKFKAVISDLEKNINELKKEITERDTTLQDKEKRIHTLKRKNQELEKYKFVLEYEIENLKSQIEPRERRIHNQKEQIDDMVNELEHLQKVIESLELQLAELREKLGASHAEYKREQKKFRQAQDLLKSMRIDLHNASGLVQEPNKLKIAVRDMYHHYNADKDFVITQVEDCNVDSEFQKQRAYLEKTVQGLKDATVKKQDDSGDERYKVMTESADLIMETNVLRQELKFAQKQNKKMASVLGISSKYMLPKEAQKKLGDACASKKTIHGMYIDRIQHYERMVMSLKDENKRLLLKMNPKKSKAVQYAAEDN